jgi:hypothetical protein
MLLALRPHHARGRAAAEMLLEIRFLGIVGAELVAEELAVGRAPRLRNPIHHGQWLAAERAASRCLTAELSASHLMNVHRG